MDLCHLFDSFCLPHCCGFAVHSVAPTFTDMSSSWDDWVPQDRLRKLTDDNRELANNLRREVLAQSAPKAPPKTTSKSRRGQGSEFGSGRGSEERSSAPITGGRGSKRARDNDIEKVGDFPVLTPGNSPVRELDMPPLIPSFKSVVSSSDDGPGPGPGPGMFSLNRPLPYTQSPRPSFTPETTPTLGVSTPDSSSTMSSMLCNPVPAYRYSLFLDGCDDESTGSPEDPSTIPKSTESRTSANSNPRPIRGGKRNVLLYNDPQDLLGLDADIHDMTTSVNVRRKPGQRKPTANHKKPMPRLSPSASPGSIVATAPTLSEISSNGDEFTSSSSPTAPPSGSRNKPAKHVPYSTPNKRPRRKASNRASQNEHEIRDEDTSLYQMSGSSPDQGAVDKSSEKARSSHQPPAETDTPSQQKTIVGRKRTRLQASTGQRFARVIVVGDPAAQPLIHSSKRCTTCVALGIRCNGEQPECYVCRSRGYLCSFGDTSPPSGSHGTAQD